MNKYDRLKIFAVVLLVLIAGGIFRAILNKPTEIKDTPIVTTPQTTEKVPDVETIHTLVNAERTKAGLPVLIIDPGLTSSAQEKCADMRDKKYYAHISPEGVKPGDVVQKYHPYYDLVGENIYHTSNFPSEDVVEGFMSSESHKANILRSDFTLVGYAVCDFESDQTPGKDNMTVQHFLDPSN